MPNTHAEIPNHYQMKSKAFRTLQQLKGGKCSLKESLGSRPPIPEITLLSLNFCCPGGFGAVPDIPLDFLVPLPYTSKLLIVSSCHDRRLSVDSIIYLFDCYSPGVSLTRRIHQN